MNSNSKVVKNSAIVLACSVLARILAYVWEAILAAKFGVSDEADAIYMTTSIFNILYPILDLGIWKVFLPAYKSKLASSDKKKADIIADTAITLFAMLSLALVLFFIVFAKYCTMLVAPGFSPEKAALTIKYLRISAPSYLLMTTASVIGAMLQCHDRFLGSQLRECGTHISKIIYFLICYRFMGIYAAVSAMIVGSVFRLLIQLPFINWKWKFRINWHFRDPEVAPMVKGLPSVAVTAAIAHINGLIDKILASMAESGSIACLNYGNRLVHVFSGMISSAISTSTYPTIVECIAQKREDRLKELLENTINILLFIIIPISLFCIVWSSNIVTAAFQRGAFDISATALTASIFTGYCVGMFSSGVSTIVTNVFYGYGDTKITLRVSIVEILCNIVFNLILFRMFGIFGLALATSLSSILCLLLRFFLLNRFVRLAYRSILAELLKILASSAAAIIVSFLLFRVLISVNLYVELVLSVLVIGVVYLLLSSLLKTHSVLLAITFVKNKAHR